MTDNGASAKADRVLSATPTEPVVSAHSGGAPLREGLCQICNRKYRRWCAASPLWNAVVRGGSINGKEAYEFLCASCFMDLAEKDGIASDFRLTAARSKPLETVTPSGRRWDEGKFLWV